MAEVSILTGPEGPVQHAHRLSGSYRRSCFNPHRARRPGATPFDSGGQARVLGFQSSPGPKARCNVVQGIRASVVLYL